MHQGGKYTRDLDNILKHACLYIGGACSAEGDVIASAEYGTGEVEDTQLGAAGVEGKKACPRSCMSGRPVTANFLSEQAWERVNRRVSGLYARDGNSTRH